MTVVHMTPRNPFASLALPPRKALFACVLATIGALLSALLAPPASALAGALLAFALAWAAAVDFDRFILPDALTLGLVVIGLLLIASHGLAAALPNIIGAIGGYLALAGLAWCYRRFRARNGLGLGDAKLLAAGGAWLGWTALPFVLLAASLTCLVAVTAVALVQRRPITSGPVPFGPYLAFAIWIVWFIQMRGGV